MSIFPMYLRMTIYPTKWSFNFFIFNLVNCKVSLYMQWLITFKKIFLKYLKRWLKFIDMIFFLFGHVVFKLVKKIVSHQVSVWLKQELPRFYSFFYSPKKLFFISIFFFYINFLNTGLFKESKLISLNKNFIQNLSPMYFNVLKVICIN